MLQDKLEYLCKSYGILLVIGRTVGWVAHNIESKLYSGRIVRPATKFVGELKEYKNIEDR